MAQLIKVSGSTVREMDTASSFGQMVPDMKVSGWGTRLTGTESSFMQMATFMRVSGATTKLRDKEPTRTQTALTTRELGLMINNMDVVLSHGPTEHAMKAITKRAKRKVKAV